MKLLFCGSSYKIGLAVLLTEHALALAKQSAVELLMVFGEKEQQSGLRQKLQEAGVKFIVIKQFDEHRNIRYLLQKIKQVITSFQPDWVMCQTNWQFLLMDWNRITGRFYYKIVYWIHGYRNNYKIRSKVALFLIGNMLKFRADKVIASPREVYNKFHPYLDKRLIFSYIGVDNIFFKSISSYHHSDHHSNTKKIVFAGQFRHGKNQEICIEVAYILKKKGYKGFEFVLPGEGEELSKCKNDVITRDLSDVVILPGLYSREEMIALYNDAFLAIVPSNNETFGSCISEPIVCGIPVISHPVGIATDVIVDHVNGYIFHSEKELIDIISNLLENNEKYNSLKNEIAKSRVLFNWETICEKYLSEL